MACTCIHRLLEVTYKNETKSKPGGLNNYYQLLQFIYTSFSELRCYPLTIYVNSTPISPQHYHSLFLKEKTLELTVEKATPTLSTNFSIFKLRLHESDVLGTGFLFTYTYGFVPSEFCSGRLINSLRVLFEDGSEVRLKEGSEGIDIGNNVCIVELDEPFKGFQPVLIEVEKPLVATQTSVYYFLRSFPQLDRKPLEVLNFSGFDLSIEVEEGALGAPVLNHENKLVGIVNSLSTILPVHDFIRNLPDFITLPSSFDINEERSFFEFYPTAGFINHDKQTAGYYLNEDAVNKTFGLDVLIPGSTATATLYGIAFVGVTQDMEPLALLFTGQACETLPRPLKTHLYHCSVFHDELLYVIGGSSCAVECFNFRENSWKAVQSLGKRRSFASVASVGKYFFVVGGKRDGKCLKSILKFRNEKWSKMKVFLPVNLAYCGMVDRKTDLLIFGGAGNDGVSNEESWRVDLKKQEVYKERFSIAGNFGRFNPLVLRDEVLVYSNSCEMFKYDFETDELCIVIVGDERLRFS